jgi:selenophosphate synthetase-related protein
MKLSELVEDLRDFPGIRRKRAIGRVLAELHGSWDFGATQVGPGDDAAVLRSGDGRCLLLAADGIISSLIEAAPYQAGRAGVLVNANDIYAMGGRPLAMVNVMAGLSEAREQEVCRGIREECLRLRVPMVGGHVSPEGKEPFLAVCVLGEARALLLDRQAGPDEAVLLALDLRGERWGKSLLNWDSHAKKDAETIAADLEILCLLAERGLAAAAKDVSNAGILGSLAMLLQGAGLGAVVDLDRLEVPAVFTLADWLRVYPSYGFVLTCKRAAVQVVLAHFRERGIWATELGRTDLSHTIRVRLSGEEALFLDLSEQGVF